jgi:hypothetical protein
MPRGRKGNGIIRKCLYCGTEFRTIPSRIKIGDGKYCSKECYFKSKKGKATWNKGISGYKQPNITIALKGWTNPSNVGEKHYNWKGGKPNCVICGKKLKNYGSEVCFTHRRSPRGDTCWNWKGGITPITKKIRHSLEYKEWRTKVFQRDGYKCVICGGKGYLQADHIESFAYHLELRFDVNNGRTLCVPCHRKTFTYGRKIYA